jgi:hypothetical protein
MDVFIRVMDNWGRHFLINPRNVTKVGIKFIHDFKAFNEKTATTQMQVLIYFDNCDSEAVFLVGDEAESFVGKLQKI